MLTGVLENIDEGLNKFSYLLEGGHLVKRNVVMKGSQDEIELDPIHFENKKEMCRYVGFG